MKKRILSFLLAGMLTAGMLAGCEGAKTSENPAADEQQSAAEESGAAGEDGGRTGTDYGAYSLRK